MRQENYSRTSTTNGTVAMQSAILCRSRWWSRNSNYERWQVTESNERVGEIPIHMMINRRKMFLGAMVALVPRVLRAADQADLARMHVLSPRPEDLEMPLDGFADWITPIDRFFVRCHTYTPKVNLSDWSLKIDGVVEQPMTLTMDDLKKLPRVELVGVLECAGNGRKFYQPRLPGAQWAFPSARSATGAGRECALATSCKRPVLRVRPRKFCSTAPMSR
jgi:Oxidoreductase molybdopterin binding domain